ncbi:RecT family recombinase [Chengkuizengella sediminis]|uniref:RecT family recombinase n=1 Tax=Chengkuizengella sediminis TaxID=1885917 RepID=UPI0013898DAD|nr:RecT family recombinase [Chengkuizengella sediminis]NDI37252.1 recombinase RecT [Chengkuizengella sediminis]
MKEKTKITDRYNKEQRIAIKMISLPNDCTKEEMIMYLYKCEELNMNPLSGEFILTKKWSDKNSKYNYSFITTRDGYLKTAQNDPHYEGIDSGVYCEGDKLSFENGNVRHVLGSTRGEVIGGWAIVKRKGLLPKTEFAPFKEYYEANKYKPIWKEMPSAMIKKVAEVAALRIMFPLTGVYTFEEMDVEKPGDVDHNNIPFNQPKSNSTSKNHANKKITASSKPNPSQEEISEDSKTEPADQESESYQTNPDGVPKMSYQLKDIKAGSSKNGTPYYLLTLCDDRTNKKGDFYALGDKMDKIDQLDLREESRVHIKTSTNENCFVIDDIELAAS